MNNLKVLTNGIFKENPTFALLLGMCPTLGVTTSAINGMGMAGYGICTGDVQSGDLTGYQYHSR